LWNYCWQQLFLLPGNICNLLFLHVFAGFETGKKSNETAKKPNETAKKIKSKM
jgi:hypothetical protein